MRTWVRELILLSVVAVVVLSARSSLASHYKVPTGSMLPTVELDDRILVDKTAYGLRIPFTSSYAHRGDDPEIGDVVILDSPVEDKVLLKRVVGTPGHTVEVAAGRIVIDGKQAPIEERAEGLVETLGEVTHPIRLTNGGGPDFGPIAIPEDKYLVMGDNRGDSSDGRMFGLVERDAILGRAFSVYWRGGLVWRDL
jgi:signal peptidase I